MKCLCLQRICSWFSQKNNEFDQSDAIEPLPQTYRTCIDKNDVKLSPSSCQLERGSTAANVPAVGTEPNRFSHESSDKVKFIFILFLHVKLKIKTISKRK